MVLRPLACRPGSHWNSGEGQTGLQHSGLIIWEVLAARPVYLGGGFHKPTHSIPKLTSCGGTLVGEKNHLTLYPNSKFVLNEVWAKVLHFFITSSARGWELGVLSKGLLISD